MSDWPLCTVPGCDNEVNPKRVALGHPTCIEDHAAPKAHFNVIEIPKSNPMVVSAGTDIKGLASSHKGNRQAF
jgi:hypothetical protein